MAYKVFGTEEIRSLNRWERAYRIGDKLAAWESLLNGAPVSATFTIGTESADTINVGVQLTDGNGSILDRSWLVRAYLSDSSTGAGVCVTPPTGGVAVVGSGAIVACTAAPADGTLVAPGLAVHSTPTQFVTSNDIAYLINGVSFTKAATTGLTFSAAHAIAASKFGVVRIQIDAAGTISTKVPASTQSYNTGADALAALPAVDAGNISLGYLLIENDSSAWTANTNNLTTDVTSATFTDATPVTLSGPKAWDIITTSTGAISLNITESGTKSFYLVVVLPTGKLAVSSAITFA